MAAPVLSKHGLSVTQHPEANDVLTTLVMHISGEWMESRLPLLLPERCTPQQLGSAITYARRYAYGAVLGIVTDEDDDGAQASQGAPGTRRPVERPAAPPANTETGEIVGGEDMEARRQRVIAEARAKAPVEDNGSADRNTLHAQNVARRLETRTRQSPMRREE